MQTIVSLSWLTLIITAGLGASLTFIGIKGYNSDLLEKKDSIGVGWSERFAIILGNGVTLLFAAVLAALLKLTQS